MADGNGNITSGEDDFEEVSFGLSHTTVTGSYGIRNDGIGVANLNLSSGTFLTLAIGMVNTGRAQITEFDTFATGAGSMLKQDTTVASQIPNGTFTYRFHTAAGFFATTSTSSAGTMTIAGGVAAGTEDLLSSSLVTSPAVTAAFNTPDASGRGTGTLSDPSTSSFVYYVVDSSTVHFISNDLGIIGLGTAEKQSGAPFGNASITGNYTFGVRADTNLPGFGTDGSGTVGQFVADGAGAITGGAYDSVQGGTTASNVALTGTYNLALNGRGTLSLTSTSGTTQQIFWMVSNGQGYLLTDDPSKVEDGAFNTQLSSAFANSTLTGQLAFITHGYNTTDTYDRVGTLIPDGNGGLRLTYLLNRSGFLSLDGSGNAATISLTGTYSVASNGRVTGSVSTLSNNLVFYLRSGNDGEILQADTGTEINGGMSKQQ